MDVVAAKDGGTDLELNGLGAADGWPGVHTVPSSGPEAQSSLKEENKFQSAISVWRSES